MIRAMSPYWGMFLIPLLLLACAKEEFRIRNTVSAKINGVDWSEDNLIIHGTYRISSTRTNRPQLHLTSYRAKDDKLPEREDFLETLGFRYINLTSLEKQKVHFYPTDESSDSTSNLFAQYLVFDHDLVLRDYEVLEMEGVDNWIQLDEIGKDKIKGRFEVALKVARGATNWIPLHRPDTLYFTEGVFEAEPYRPE